MEKLMKKVFLAVVAGSYCLAANAANYTIDPNHTQATFSFQHLGLSTFNGKIPAKSGSVALDRAQNTGSIEVVFDLKGIATGVPDFDKHLRSADFFDVEKHPTAVFKSNKLMFNGETPASVAGNLTIKGITKPVTLKVTSFKCVDEHPMEKTPACGANASASIKRSDFGFTYALPAVLDEIKLEVEIEALQK
jgi:polyisoprenoid-binding protein YceI